MTLDAVVFQALNGLAAASGLFFVGAGLSLIFGVTRIVNMAHGSLYMVGLYLAYSIATAIGGGWGYWTGVAAAALLVAGLGALIEITLLRRIYHVPELYQLLATFALVLVLNDATLWLWGPEDLLGPRAPGLRGAVDVLGRRFSAYDLFMIAIGPIALLILHLALARTRFGRLVRAATQDREMAGALGVNQALLFTAVFTAGSLLSGRGGSPESPRISRWTSPSSAMLSWWWWLAAWGRSRAHISRPSSSRRSRRCASASGWLTSEAWTSISPS